MKQLTALALALALFTLPMVVLAAEWNGPSLDQIFGENYQETIVFDEGE